MDSYSSTYFRNLILGFVNGDGKNALIETLCEHIYNMIKEGEIEESVGEKVIAKYDLFINKQSVVILLIQLALDGRGTFARDELDVTILKMIEGGRFE